MNHRNLKTSPGNSFTYDGDGRRVIATEAGTTTVFIGNYFEWKNSAMTKYYYAGGQRLAVRNGNTSGTSQLSFLLTDHLGSTRLTYRADLATSELASYSAWGVASGAFMNTRYTYTGQYSYTATFGLMYYNARWYDPTLNRFAQADTIIPVHQGTQAYDRYAYANNNPIKFSDPSGHFVNVAIGAGIGLIAGVGLYTLNVLRTDNGNLSNWNLGDAALVGATGALAGALIGTGVGATAGVAALTNAVTLSPGAAAMASTTIASAGAGIIAGWGGYLASNIAFGNEFDGSDFTIASAVGGATGALGSTYATTSEAATLLGAASNTALYGLTQIANGNDITFEGALLAAATGAVGGRIGGGYYNPKNGYYSIDYYDLHPGELPSNLAQQVLTGGVRSFAGSTITNFPLGTWGEKIQSPQ